MKKLSTISFFALVLVAIAFLAQTNLVLAYPSGSPAGYTGSPGDGQHCQSCHGGNNATVNGWITSNIPTQGYTPGTTYSITATASGTGKKGFEISPQSVSGAQLGILAAGTGNHLVGGTKYVTQNSSGASGSTVSWTFSWTAPAAGTGAVVFYGAFTVGKQNTKLTTLEVQENAALPLSVTAVAVPDLICSGQTVQLEAAATGGTSSYTYLWSSDPPGFTSTLHNPSVNPDVSTLYSVEVTDGTSTAGASVQVTVQQHAVASAGPDTLCAYNVTGVPYQGVAQNYFAVEWYSSGTGTFSNPSGLSGLYYPSVSDKEGGQVELTLNVFPLPPCTLQPEDSRIISFEDPIGMAEEEGVRWYSVFPNPSDGNSTITLMKKGNMEITVTDLRGSMIFRETLSSTDGSFMQYSLQNLHPGVYFINVNDGVECRTSKLIVY